MFEQIRAGVLNTLILMGKPKNWIGVLPNFC